MKPTLHKDADVSQFQELPLDGQSPEGRLMFATVDSNLTGYTSEQHYVLIGQRKYVNGDRGVHVLEMLPGNPELRQAVIERYNKDGVFFLLSIRGALWVVGDNDWYTINRFHTIEDAIAEVTNHRYHY